MVTDLPKILVVEDEINILYEYGDELEERGKYEVHLAASLDEASKQLSQVDFSVVLTDLRLGYEFLGGFAIFDKIKRAAHNQATQARVIIFTGKGDSTDANEAMQKNVYQYLTKPLNFDIVCQFIDDAITDRQQSIEAEKRRRERQERYLPTPEALIYASTPMNKLINEAMRLVRRLARKPGHILIIGEAGTGKKLLAEGIHRGTHGVAFERVNCGGLSESTLDQIIFGHYDEKNEQIQHGILRHLTGGTLVLERVSELSLLLQDKLMKALTSGEYTMHEGIPPIVVDLRIISLSLNQDDLTQAVEQGFFLAKLGDLLSENTLYIPPLSERQDEEYNDILLLANHFVSKHSSNMFNEDKSEKISIDDATIQILETYPFPGNVQELSEAIRVALSHLQTKENVILPQHLPSQMQKYR